MRRPENTRALHITGATQSPSIELADPPDRFRIRRSLALFSAAALVALVLTVLIVVLGGTQDMAERLNTIQGFAGVLVTALVTIIMGYGVSAHLDDRQNIEAGRTPQGDSYPPRGESPTSDSNDPLASVIHSAGRAAAKSYDVYTVD